MYNVEFVQILDTCYDLMKESAGLRLFNSLISHNVVKQLSSACILHNQIELLWSLNYLIELNNVGMSNEFEDMNFSCDSLHVTYILDLVLL